MYRYSENKLNHAMSVLPLRYYYTYWSTNARTVNVSCWVQRAFFSYIFDLVQSIQDLARSRLPSNKNLCSALNIFLLGVVLQSVVIAEERRGLIFNAGLSLTSDTNITRTAEKTDDKAAIFTPQIQFLSSIGPHKFLLDYQGEFATYTDNSQYNYNVLELDLAAIFAHSYRLNSEIKLGYHNKIEEPGSSNAAAQLSNEFNQFIDKSALARVYYGTKSSSGQIVVGLHHNKLRFTNNEQSYRDLDKNKLTGTFFYRMAPKTRLLFEASLAEYEYISAIPSASPSSDENLYLVGVEWEATAITSGIFKLGYHQKDYQDVRFDDLAGLSYFLDMNWKPNTYTNIRIGANRLTRESAQLNIGGFINTGVSLAVEHAFSQRTSINAIYQQDESDFTLSQGRTDKRNSIKVAIVYSLRTWLDISLDYRHLARSSTDEIYNFSADSVELSLVTRFD